VLCDDVICFSPGQKVSLHSALATFPFWSNAIRVKNQFKENPKTSKTTEEATKENKNDVTDGYENEAESL